MTRQILGTSGSELISGTSADESIIAGGGNDTIWGGSGGTDTLVLSGLISDYAIASLGNGSYTLFDQRAGSPDGIDTIRDIDFLTFSNGTLSLTDFLNQAPNFVAGTSGNDDMLGSAANDVFQATAGNDHIWGGFGGADTALFTGNVSNYAFAANANGSITIFDTRVGSPDGRDTLRGIEVLNFNGTSYGLAGLAGLMPNFVGGTAGADNQGGTAGNDVFQSTAGNDKIWGVGGANDILVLSGNLKDYLFQHSGDGGLNIRDLRASGSEGIDKVRDIDTFRFADQTLTWSQLTSVASAAQANPIGGTSQADVLLGTGGDDVMTGGAGHDRVWGGKGGYDTAMYSGKFSDYIITDNDNGSLTVVDKRVGSPDGTDVVRDIEAFRFADRLVLANSVVTAASEYGRQVMGGSGTDVVQLATMSQLFGAHTNDILAGNGGDDELRAGPGNDLVIGDDPSGIVAATTLSAVVVSEFIGSQNATPGLKGFSVAANATATVTFHGETAGFQNTLGVYKIAADGSIYDVKVLFPNSSQTGSGGSLTPGSSSASFNMQAGEQMGFFIIPNGFGQSGNGALLSNASANWRLVNANGTAANIFGGKEMYLASVGANGSLTYAKSQYGNSIFHSIDTTGQSGLNGDRFVHVTNALQMANGAYKMGFEDLWGGGDRDYDDTIFSLSVNNPDADLALRSIGSSISVGGGDILYGGAGDDSLLGQAGNDRLNGGKGADILRGGTGFDTADYSHAPAAVIVDLKSGGQGGEAQGDTYFDIEQVAGSAYADTIRGSDNADVLDSRGGNDVLDGRGGNDVLRGGAGADNMNGNTGFDTASYYTSSAGVAVDLGQGSGSSGDAAGDVLTSIERVQGSNTGDDTLGGSFAFDVLEGHGGNDNIDGRAGADYLSGGAGDDTLKGGAGNDGLSGGNGTDTAIYDGVQSGYQVTQNQDGSWTVRDLAGNEGIDTLKSVEILSFADGQLSLLA
jgi:Ca2+-binding RTX toxin-like protein